MTDAPTAPANAAVLGGIPPTLEQQTVLQAIYNHFYEHGTWPTFNQIDRPIRREHGWNAADVIEHLSNTLLSPPSPGNSRPAPQDCLRLTLDGITACRGSEEDTARFAQILRWLAKLEVNEPTVDADGALPQVTSLAIAAYLELDADDLLSLERLRGMLSLDHWGLGGFGENVDGRWYVMLTPDIWRFREVQTVQDCIKVRANWLAEDDLRSVSSIRYFPMSTTDTSMLLQAPPAAQPPVADTGQPIAARPRYVAEQIADAIKAKAGSSRFDLTKLLALINELNDNYADQHTYATHALLRAILDHVPPILRHQTFKEAVNNYAWSRTDEAYMRKLLDFRAQADDALHRPISGKASLLTFADLPPGIWINRLLQECTDQL